MGRVTQDALRPLASIGWMNVGPVSLVYMRSMCAGVKPDHKQSSPSEYIHSALEATLF